MQDHPLDDDIPPTTKYFPNKTNTMETIYTTVKHDQYGDVLVINGKESQCPYKPGIPVPVQSTLGQMQMQIVNFPCCTVCPHAHIEQLGLQDGDHYIISCTGEEKDIELSRADYNESNILLNI
jgi:hypothetical protein